MKLSATAKAPPAFTPPVVFARENQLPVGVGVGMGVEVASGVAMAPVN